MEEKELNEELNKDAEEVKEETEEKAAESSEETEKAEETKAEKETKGKSSSKEGKKSKKTDKKYDQMKQQIADLQDQVKRQWAEFDNFRKRTEKEKSAMFETGAKSIIEKILPVVDNFERGLETVPEEEKGTPFHEGMEMIYKQLINELEKVDVKPIDAVGKEFDPDFHNAVMQVESDEFETGFVAKELQKGYTYRDSVVRHSMVAVVQ